MKPYFRKMLKARLIKDRLEAGCDEVGRGCLAGPVVAAAVILPSKFRHEMLYDSKQLSESQRIQMFQIIKDQAVAYAVSFVAPVIIDRINILNASFLAMTRAINRLSITPDHLVIDGNKFRSELEIPFTCVVKGDSKVGSIAAASILAKTYRDEYMRALHQNFPDFGWNHNVGYPTEFHREAVRQFGQSPHHRKSFSVKSLQLEFDL